ncbi:hypothetical protein HOLleu_42607 [Holothuria leucospilota]|uniref:Uncharacterized protein n=1 Tax=Holothuria leucospilota TaxID=206669 RepID=A0A9Q1BBJ2_HOLLE|nr:hypothetical protein HOLleu_42607 [Holothuria leucospilota]
MEVKVGERVQAVDELGRWANGKVAAVGDDFVTVHFPGWDEDFDVTLQVSAQRSKIRRPVDSFVGKNIHILPKNRIF